MSTCVGAPPPHKDCPHGRNCDWVSPAQAKQLHDAFPDNREGRRALERAMKREQKRSRG